MSSECNTYEEQMHAGFWWGNLREAEPGVHGRIILKWIFDKWVGIDLAQDRNRWRTLVSAVINVWVPYNAGNFLTS
jgi:hypothetical protein